jgi:transcriptional regulator of aromatic amino acid metabolism
MVFIIDFLQTLDTILGSYPFLLFVFSFFFILKTYLLFTLIKNLVNAKIAARPAFFLIFVLIGALVGDSAWIFKIIKTLFFPNFDFRIYMFWVRISWGFSVLHDLALAFFIESLVEQKNYLNIRQKLFVIISSFFFTFFIGLAIYNFNIIQFSDRLWLELFMQKISTSYYLFLLMGSSIFFAFHKIRTAKLPRILAKQLKILISAVIVPYWLFDLLQIFPFDLSPTWITNSYTFVSLSNMFLTLAVFYCTYKIIGLRFLNFKNHVQAPTKFNFIDNFKNILEQLSHVSTLQELRHISQGFFKEAFGVPINRTILYIRKTRTQDVEVPESTSRIPSLVETFIATQEDLGTFIKQSKILIYDEIAFNNFYEETDTSKAILHFLETINADIFIPVYEKNKLIAYIIIDRYARLNEFYSDIERDEMLVFVSYLGNIINLLQNRNLDTLIHQEKKLQEELYHKHQEINQYKESIRSFLRTSKQKEIGIIFYKHRHFTLGNQAAKELIKINLNTQDGHPLTKIIKTLAQQVEEYKSPQTQFAKDSNGKPIVLSAVPHLEKNNVIISVYYPEISDILKKQLDLLKDPTEWDYLLYLETTQSGQLINQLIPSSGETLLNFKINLLKIALSKKAILLDMPEEDILPTVELLHHISLRKTLQIIDLKAPTKSNEIAIKLFGMSPIFAPQGRIEQPILAKLNDTGTLFIKNIHLLDLETQEYLAEFIKYGLYRVYKSEQKEPSNVRIICSSAHDLLTLIQEGTFSQALFNELNKTTIALPSLLTLPEDELNMLADGFTEQAVKTQTFKNILSLSSKDKSKLAHARPASLQELKIKVQQLLAQKSKENQIYHETQFDPAYEVTDPDLIEAARLGKHALKDQRIMNMLWHKFKNQNKIASFLGVNRSSVNRRCKDYGLVE